MEKVISLGVLVAGIDKYAFALSDNLGNVFQILHPLLILYWNFRYFQHHRTQSGQYLKCRGTLKLVLQAKSGECDLLKSKCDVRIIGCNQHVILYHVIYLFFLAVRD